MIMFKVLNVTETHSMTRKGKPSDYFAVDIDYMGEKVKVKTPKADVKPGDYVELGYDVERNEHCSKLMIAIKSVIPGADVEGQEETAEPEGGALSDKKKRGRIWGKWQN